MKKVKYLLVTLLAALLAGPLSVNATEFLPTDKNLAETGENELIYVIGTHLFTEKTSYISSEIMMYAAQTIDLPEGIEGIEALNYMNIYMRDLEGNWTNALTGKAVTFTDDFKFNVKFKDLEKYALTVKNVSSLEELEEALADSEIKTINLTASFNTDHSIVVNKEVTINGNGNTITMTGTNGWVDKGDNYVIKVYNTNATIKDIKLTGANAALQVNSSNVILEGNVDVTGNVFGGVEVSRGSGLANDASLTVNGTITMTDELANRPAVWVENGEGTVTASGFTEVVMNLKDQTFYFANEEASHIMEVKTLKDLEYALNDSRITTINIMNDIKGINKTLVLNHTATINGNNHSLEFGLITKFDNVASGLVITADNSAINDLTIKMTDEAGWDSHYGMQVYDASNVTINNYTGTGGDAALIVNASNVILTGTITVSGNEYGGIEVSKGSGEDLSNPSLDATNATIVNADEASYKASIWEDKVSGTVTTNLTKVTGLVVGQTHYFNVMPEANVDSVDKLEAALKTNLKVINLTTSFNTEHSIIVNREVTINGNGNTITMMGNDTWVDDGDNYVIKVYNTNATIKDIKLTGAQAALQANASNVTLEGNIDVTGNALGGIEVSRGKGLTNDASLTVNGTITMTDELNTRPAIWLENGEGKVNVAGLTEVANTAKNQTFYFVNEAKFESNVPSAITVSDNLDKPETITENASLTLKADTVELQKVRFRIENVVMPEGADAKVWAKDTNGNIYDIITTGWGPAEGFDVPVGYKATTSLQISASVAGEYSADVVLYEVATGNVIKTLKINFTAATETAE